MSIIYVLIAGALLIATLVWVAMKWQNAKDKKDVAESNIKASEGAKETAEAVINHESGAGIAELRKLRENLRS